MTNIINRDFFISDSRSGGIMSSIMFRFLAVFVNIIENLKKLF